MSEKIPSCTSNYKQIFFLHHTDQHTYCLKSLMKKSWDYTQLNTGILHIHDDHLKFYSDSWGHNFVEIDSFMKWILIQVYFFVGSGMLTLYKVQKLSFIIKKGKGYTIHEKVQLSDDAIYMYMYLQARWKSRYYHSSYRNRIKSSLLILQDVSFLSNWAYHSTIHQLIRCSQTSFEVDDTVCIQRDQTQHDLFTFDLWTSPSSVSPTPRSFLVFNRLCRSPLLCFL